MYPLNAEDKSIQIEGGPWARASMFNTTHGYYAQGVGPETAVLPEGWKDRLQRVQTQATEGRVGYCLDVLDLFMAKTVANREKDREFNMALLRLGYVNSAAAIDMVAVMPVDAKAKRDMRIRIRRWVKLLKDRGFEVPGA